VLTRRRLGTIWEGVVPRLPPGSRNVGNLRVAAPAVPVAGSARLDRYPPATPGSPSPLVPSAMTWTGCAGSAIRSTRGRVWPAGTGSARTVPWRRRYWTTRRRSRSDLRTAACGPIAGDRGDLAVPGAGDRARTRGVRGEVGCRSPASLANIAARSPWLLDADGLPSLRGLPVRPGLGRPDQPLGRIRDRGQVGDRPIAGIGRQRPEAVWDLGGDQGLVDRLQHGLQLLQVVGVLVSSAATTICCSATMAWAL
jgi:hypothetical protein